ncbi:Gfo/Idh/MocA family protein [Alkalicoccobacillus murimartini]|uniref:Dehydrogenase n=1 Tax=Alkalicoccobacillus murimartini TaxID=171685 RepID=A0ABT9YLE2_9BACI|nr:Gfo/Idh/MocA family oxidoreductase [Alkalicoccobacillus murimartini]MDQ0208701.1 putative dehydrogenase [Alkalicoccobacillus murimartini]
MKVGIVGSGMIVKDLLSFIHTIPSITLEGIYARSLDKAQALQKEHTIQHCYTEYDKMLESSKIDTVYIGLPNHLHYSYAKQALLKGKHVICEKPFTPTLKEFNELAEIAQSHQVMLLEAISNQYQKSYLALHDYVPKLGEIRIIECNYSQYSSRYTDFKHGVIHPVFNPEMSGGALMDINIYNIHFVIGLVGQPNDVQYFPNIESNIDTSGILILDYGSFKSVCIGSKDSKAPHSIQIQGDRGTIHITNPTNDIKSFHYMPHEHAEYEVTSSSHHHRMYDEFVEFALMIQDHDYTQANERLKHSKRVMQVLESAKLSVTR